jgi:Ras-related protein Rab-6A
MNNSLDSIASLESICVFSREGLLIGKKERGRLVGLFSNDKKAVENDDVLQAVSSIVQPTLTRIASECPGTFGTGTFETEEHSLVFTESGPEAILLCVFKADSNLQKLLPYVFLISEKVASIVEGIFTQYHTLTIPDLELFDTLDINHADVLSERGFTSGKSEYRFKLIVLGDEAVGKTSTINSFVLTKFVDDYRPTLGISITNQAFYINGIKNSKISFQIWDLAGQKFFKRIRKHYFKGSHAVFIVFDITNRQTFDHIEQWYLDVMDETPDVPCVLVGNKVDLVDDRVVSPEEGKAKAKQLRMTYLETSAKTGENIRDLFSILGVGLFFKQQANED